MGHPDIQTTIIYVHHVPKVEAVDEMSNVVEAAMGAGVEVSAYDGLRRPSPAGGDGVEA